ncbi:MAG TPA: YraN family protein [Burkholderiales bacterium]|nr:YraN family protein [Burkholderiales bacterium]
MNNLGQDAEARAARYLEAQGLHIVERNYRCRWGEIDLIARDGVTLVFIEVRARSSNAFGGAAASITTGKREKLTRTAQHYLASIRHAPRCRFDALLLSGSSDGSGALEWIQDAFSAD